MWTFDTDGNLTLPGNLVIAGNTSVGGANAALIAPADNLPLLSLSSGSNGGVSSLWIEDFANVGISNIAAVYANPTPGSGIVRIAVGQNGSPGPNLWDFGATGNLTLPGNTVAINFANGSSAFGNIVATNLDGNVSNLLTGNGTYVAIPVVPTVGNIATINLDGSNSNVLYGNGIFAAVPAPTVAQDITSNGAMSIMTYDGNLKYVNYATVEPSSGNIAGGNISANGAVTANTAIITTGNITTINSGLLQNGNSNITITSNGNVSIQAAGSNVELVVTSTGANVTGTFNATGNANVGNLSTTTAIITTGNITTINSGLLQNGNSNITITSNGNVSIQAAGSNTAFWTFGTDGVVTIPGEIASLITPQVGSSLTIATNNFGGLTGYGSQALSVTYNANIISTYAVGSTITWQDDTTATITQIDDYGPTYIDIFWDTPKSGTLFPITLETANYAAATTANASIAVGDNTWVFDNTGNLTLPTGGALTTTGNITGGNLITTGNVSASNVIINGQTLTATGAVNPDYINMTTSAAVNVAASGTDLTWDVNNGSSGIAYSAGKFSLSTGKTYHILAELALQNYSANGYLLVELVDGTTNARIGSQTVTLPYNSGFNEVNNPTLDVIHTPVANQDVKLRVTGGTVGLTAQLRGGGFTRMSIVQLNPTASLSAVSTISASGNINVGGNLTVTGGVRKSNRIVTTTATLTVADASGFIQFNNGPYTVTLPDPTQAANAGIGYRFWQNTASNITLSTPAGAFFGPSGTTTSTVVLAQATTQYWDVWSDGFNWAVFGIKIA
jgi:hypothetical protein